MICDLCKKKHFRKVKGWESQFALECPACGQYYYYVGGIQCSYWSASSCATLTREFLEKELEKLPLRKSTGKRWSPRKIYDEKSNKKRAT